MGSFLIDLRDGVTLADGNGSLISTLRIQTRDAPQRYLKRLFEAWITEYGYPTCDPGGRPKQFRCVTQEMQAAYETRGLLLGLSQKVTLWSTYELADEGDDPSDPEQNFGLVTSARDRFTPKQSFYSLQRVHHLLGYKWRYMTEPPESTVVSSFTGPYTGSDNSPIEGPQLLWFKVDNGYLAFLWQAGPYQNGDTSERLVLRISSKFAGELRAIDLATGDTIKRTKSRGLAQEQAAEITVTSAPIALQFLRAPESRQSISHQPVATRPILRPQSLKAASA